MLRWMIVFALSIVISGCGRQAVQCTADSAQAPVVTIVKEQLEKKISANVRKDDGSRAIGLSKIRAAIAQLVITLDDIRTSKEDPNSTKRFCTGVLKIRFPADVLTDADAARTAAGLNSVSNLADANDVERQADSFTMTIDFNVQPTDDGSKVFAETESGDAMFTFASEVLTSGLMKSAVEDSKRIEQQAADAQSAAQETALSEQRGANLNVARTENQLAVQTLTATWKALGPDTRARMLPLQRAWIRKKDADCRVEAASASVDATELEVARLNCDTRISQERTNYLAPMRTEYEGMDTMTDANGTDMN